MFTKDKHYSIDLENTVLGSFLIEPTAFGRCYGTLKKDVFYKNENVIIFDTIEKMWSNNEPVDIHTVCIKLVRSGYEKLDNSNTSYYITRLTNTVVSTANLEYHSLLLRQFYVEREMIKITNSGIGQSDAVSKIKELQQTFLSLLYFISSLTERYSTVAFSFIFLLII